MRKRTNVGASTEGKVEAAEDSIEAREKTIFAAQKCATEKKIPHLCMTESIDV